MKPSIYMDNSATTPMDPRVVDAMLPALRDHFGNPSSLHAQGQVAKQAVADARLSVANLIGAQSGEILFTASGTESDNLALIGSVESFGFDDAHIITSAFEHPAVLETCKYLAKKGVQIDVIRPDSDGIIHPDVLQSAMKPQTRLVSVLTAHNVVGTLQPIGKLARIAREQGALFHTDAVQAAGKIPIDVSTLGVDLLSISAHKLHGPKGIGALYVRKGVTLAPIIHGGGQEKGLRSATENVAGIVGFGVAAKIARDELAIESHRLASLRDRIIDGVLELIPNAYLIGHREHRLPGHICLGFDGQEGEAIHLLMALDQEGIAVSTGSACSANHASQPSYVLLAMGFDPLKARGSLRITLGRFNTPDDVDALLDALPRAVGNLRSISTRKLSSLRNSI